MRRIPEAKKRNKTVVSSKDSFLGLHPTWRFSLFDRTHPSWGARVVDANLMLEKLGSYEGMTWSEIQSASGAKKHGNMNHFVSVESIIKDARDRLQDLNLFTEDQLFSLVLHGRQRLWGFLSDGVFSIIWYDKEHQIYPMQK